MKVDTVKPPAFTVTEFPVGTTAVAHVASVVLRQPVPERPAYHVVGLVNWWLPVVAEVFADVDVVVLLELV
jgi:hypothetical protein